MLESWGKTRVINWIRRWATRAAQVTAQWPLSVVQM
jgi:hypothetical protein